MIQQAPVPVPQVPDPPVPPDFPVEILGGGGEWVAVAGMLTGIVITGMFVLGPIGRALGAVIKHWLAGGNKTELPAEDIDELHARLDAVTKQVAELAERQDFTDRMLAQVRKDRALPGAGAADVAG